MPSRTPALIIATLLAVAVVSATLASGATTTKRNRAVTSRTITFYQGDDPSQTFVDAVPLSPTADSISPRFHTSRGDRLYFGGPVFTRKGGRSLGRIDFELTALRGKGDKVVTFMHGIVVLQDGILTLDGIYPRLGGLAVTGGTGAYAGARGVARQDDNGIDTITLIP